MMYQARVDAVKVYYMKKLNQKIDDKLARPIELNYEEYLDGKQKWCSNAVWPKLCRYWCSENFLKKRKRGQESRFSSDDIAQNQSWRIQTIWGEKANSGMWSFFFLLSMGF